MPYILKGQREWMTLREAISHIQHVDGCDEAVALQQLREALADGEITGHARTHYQNSAVDEFFEISFRGWRDPQWPRDKYWLSVPIKLDQHRVDATAPPDEAEPSQVDDRGGGPRPRTRPNAAHADEGLDEDYEEGLSRVPYPLLFPRAAILEIWWEEPLIAGENETSAENKNSDLKTGDKDDVREAARLLYGKDPRRPPNNRKAPGEIAKLLADKGLYVSRIRVRQVLKEPEFKSKRRGPGERVRKD
jgi:hypothetical protein